MFNTISENLYDSWRGLQFTYESHFNNLIKDKTTINPVIYNIYKIKACTYTIISSFHFVYQYLKPRDSNIIWSDRDNKTTLSVEYKYDDQIYNTFIIINKDNPKRFCNAYKLYKIKDDHDQVIYQKGDDISIMIKKILGPNEDFHGIKLSPRDLFLEGVEISTMNLVTFDIDTTRYVDSEIISLNE
jgi:hypothetical protein